MRTGIATILLITALLLLSACEAESVATQRPSATLARTPALSSTSTTIVRPTERPSSYTPEPIVTAEDRTATAAANHTATSESSIETNVPATANPDTPDHIDDAITKYGAAVAVDRVVDGDTIDVVLEGSVVRVRIIGVDTPEVHGGVDCYGPEASSRTTELIEQAGWQVFLEKDVSETDRYDRLLRYVWLPHPDGLRMLNFELVASGHAQVSTYPPDVKHQEWFLAAQREAAGEGRGLWGGCGTEPESQPTTAPSSPGAGCDPSYPTVCIPPYPPDLDCGEISYRRFQVLPPDPHGFDRDRDGIGCESG